MLVGDVQLYTVSTERALGRYPTRMSLQGETEQGLAFLMVHKK